jgi:hypothetical protein
MFAIDSNLPFDLKVARFFSADCNTHYEKYCNHWQGWQ